MDEHAVFSQLGRPARRVAERATCFYDTTALPSQTREHFFNDCWGGSEASHKLICDTCNGDFSAIDGCFGVYTEWVFNAWQFKPSRRHSVPSVHLDGDYELRPGAIPALKEPKVVITHGEKLGHARIQGTANSKGEIRRMLEDGTLEAQLGYGLTDKQKADILAGLRNLKPTPSKVGEQSKRFELDLQAQYRSAAHTAFKCLALYEPDLLADERTRALRDFARHGTGQWTDFAVFIEPTPAELAAREQFSLLYNQVEITWSPEQGRVFAVLTLLGMIRRAFVLAEGYAGPDRTLGMLETTGSGPRHFHPYVFEFQPNWSGLPRLDVRPAPASPFFMEELRLLVSETNTSGPILGQARRDFVNLEKNHPTLTPQALADLTTALLRIVIRTASLNETPIAESTAMTLLAAGGLDELARDHQGKPTRDDGVAQLAIAALMHALAVAAKRPDGPAEPLARPE